jgi:hypothetical protein
MPSDKYRMPKADSLPRRLFRRFLAGIFNVFGLIAREPYRNSSAKARTAFAAHVARVMI